MATWTEVQRQVRQSFSLDRDEAGEFALTVPRRDGRESRAQRVMVRRYQAWGETMIEVRSAFGELGSFKPEELLAQNLQLPLGSVALHGRYLVLVHKAPLAHLSLEGVLFLLTRVSQLADVLEERQGGDRF